MSNHDWVFLNGESSLGPKFMDSLIYLKTKSVTPIYCFFKLSLMFLWFTTMQYHSICWPKGKEGGSLLAIGSYWGTFQFFWRHCDVIVSVLICTLWVLLAGSIGNNHEIQVWGQNKSWYHLPVNISYFHLRFQMYVHVSGSPCDNYSLVLNSTSAPHCTEGWASL